MTYENHISTFTTNTQHITIAGKAQPLARKHYSQRENVLTYENPAIIPVAMVRLALRDSKALENLSHHVYACMVKGAYAFKGGDPAVLRMYEKNREDIEAEAQTIALESIENAVKTAIENDITIYKALLWACVKGCEKHVRTKIYPESNTRSARVDIAFRRSHQNAFVVVQNGVATFALKQQFNTLQDFADIVLPYVKDRGMRSNCAKWFMQGCPFGKRYSAIISAMRIACVRAGFTAGDARLFLEID